MNEQFAKYFQEQGFTVQTPIQKEVIPALAAGRNVVGLAPTGSGKTLAYILPLLEKVMPGDGLQVVILVPSQELAVQITNVTRAWARLINIKVQAVIGGANMRRQVEKLRHVRPEVVVGTPGRINDLITAKRLKMHQVIAIVMDEADALLAEEASREICRAIVSRANADVQLGFFSATATPILDELHRWFGVQVTRIDVRATDHTQGAVTHYMVAVPTRKRVDALRKLARMAQMRALVFCSQTATVRELVAKLQYHHVPVAALISGINHQDRAHALSSFRKGQLRLLLTTDVAARGLDLPGLPAVINYDIARDLRTYVHRVGRTGRMGAPGMVINLGNEHQLRSFRQLIRPNKYTVVDGVIVHGELVAGKRSQSPKNKHPAPVSQKTQQLTANGRRKHRKKRRRNQKNKGVRRKRQS
ncbi:DEAD/DEAH box helicase [Ligilactobacillus sp. LYQ60]|uniref:DEAD/DEAH box helicase n=1 Tax=unclassified Ligilactobacillus TaxID=2767920 RepID=UPI0038552114